jgi:hypothetical protein
MDRVNRIRASTTETRKVDLPKHDTYIIATVNETALKALGIPPCETAPGVFIIH